MALLLLKVSAIFYLVAALFGAVQHRWPRVSGDRTVMVALLVAILSHAVAIGCRTVECGSFPPANLHDGLSLFGFLAAVIAVGIAWRGGIPQASSLAATLVTAIVLLSVWIEPAEAMPERLRSPWLPVHIALAFLGEAAFAVAGLVAGVYLVQERRLKAKKRRKREGSGVQRLPALEVLDAVSVRLIQLGFPLMSVGLLAGAVYGKQVFGSFWSWGLLNIVSVLVWLLYALLLHFRLTIGWRGKKAAVLTLAGFIVTLVALVGLGLAGVGAHGEDFVS